jgi:hypothetical protein
MAFICQKSRFPAFMCDDERTSIKLDDHVKVNGCGNCVLRRPRCNTYGNENDCPIRQRLYVTLAMMSPSSSGAQQHHHHHLHHRYRLIITILVNIYSKFTCLSIVLVLVILRLVFVNQSLSRLTSISLSLWEVRECLRSDEKL